MNTVRPSVSVAMAVFNGAPFLKEQLDSILANLIDTDELVISDDGSDNITKELVKTYCTKYKKIKYIEGPGKGIKQNFANAIRHCRNDVIFLSDQDDIWMEDKVSTILPLFHDPECMVVNHNAEIFDGNSIKQPTSTFEWRNSHPGILYNIWKNSYMGCCMAFRRELVEYILPIPDTIEMHDQWIGILGETRGISVFPDQKLIRYRRHGQNASELTHHSLPVMLSNRFHLIIEFLHRICTNKQPESLQQNRMNGNTRFTKGDFLLCFILFVVCLIGSFLLPMDQCPDEGGRQMLTDFLLKYRRLPIGNEPEVLLGGWGFSYALRPYLSSLISAFFGRLISLFTDSPFFLRPAFRFGSVLSVVFTAVYSLKTGKLLFRRSATARLYASTIAFLPQVLFLGMYLNNDSLSLLAVSMILYYYLQGLCSHWSLRCCIGLGISFSIALLSYYTIYGWILIAGLFFLASLFKDNVLSTQDCLKRLSIVAGICVILAAPFFIRNGILHEGDIFGIISEEKTRADLAKQGYELFSYNCLKEQGYSLTEFFRYSNGLFIKSTLRSFIGYFGYMTIPLQTKLYYGYYLYFLCGLLLFLRRMTSSHRSGRFQSLFCILLYSSIITFLLHVYQCYKRDFQAQGRYVITLILFLAYMVGYGVEYLEDVMLKAKYSNIPACLLNVVYFIFAMLAVFFSMTKMLP